MKTNKPTFVIPTYWGRGQSGDDIVGDEKVVFDHPTSLDSQGTLSRLLDSFNILDGDYFIVIIPVSNTPDIVEEVEKKVIGIVDHYSNVLDISILGYKELKNLSETLKPTGISSGALELLNLDSYSSVRNICSIGGLLNNSDVTIFIDDDELFIDKRFLARALENINKNIGQDVVKAVAGFYLQPDDYHLNLDSVPSWRCRYWNNASAMNLSFDKIIGSAPRLKVTPFVFGGNMILHKDVTMNIPFDPLIPRGEDIDFLINCRINNIKIYLDNRLSIKHLPPHSSRPSWKGIREDIKRFLYERLKVNAFSNIISIDELMPYPGMFLGDDLDERIIKTNNLLKKDYLASNNELEASECDKNIELLNDKKYKDFDVKKWLLELQSNWQELTRAITDSHV